MQPLAIGRGVIKAALRREDVVTIVGEAGVGRHRRPQRHHSIEERRELVPCRDIGCGGCAPRGLAHRPVGALQERREPRQRHLGAVPRRHHRARDLLVLGGESLGLRHQRHVGLAEDLDRGPEAAQRGDEVRPIGPDGHQLLRERDLGLLELREDLGREPKVRGFLRGVRGVAGIRDHRQRGGLGDQLVESGPAGEPRLQRRRVDRRRGEFGVPGRQIGPGRVGEAGGRFGKGGRSHSRMIIARSRVGGPTPRPGLGVGRIARRGGPRRASSPPRAGRGRPPRSAGRPRSRRSGR